jgi:hypothetical protein
LEFTLQRAAGARSMAVAQLRTTAYARTDCRIDTHAVRASPPPKEPGVLAFSTALFPRGEGL